MVMNFYVLCYRHENYLELFGGKKGTGTRKMGKKKVLRYRIYVVNFWFDFMFYSLVIYYESLYYIMIYNAAFSHIEL